MAENNLTSYREEKLADEINQVHNALTSAAQLPRLAERIFVGVFLPFFAGDDPLPYKVGSQFWVDVVSGSPFSSVEIVNAQNEVLFTVPPIYDRAAIQPVGGEGRSIAHVVASADQLTRVHPTQGQNYLSAELTRRALIMKVPTNVLRHLETWNEIFKRYGRPPIVALEEDKKVSPPSGESGQDDMDYEFEPL